MEVDLSYMQTGRRTVARILVGLQVYKGLADKLPIESVGGTHIHRLITRGFLSGAIDATNWDTWWPNVQEHRVSL